MSADQRANLAHLGDIDVEAVVEMGRQKTTLDATRDLAPGSVIVLDRLAGEYFDVRLNGALLGHGEIVCIGDNLSCRITRMVHPKEGGHNA